MEHCNLDLFLPEGPLREPYIKTRDLMREYNTSIAYMDFAAKEKILRQVLGGFGKNVRIEAPFFCDFGENIFLGDNVFINFNCTFLDGSKITIGGGTLLAPNCQLHTAHHPIMPNERIVKENGECVRVGCESDPIAVGENCWIGGGTIITPGVTIGDNVVVGAGSIVTRDIPSNVVAAGAPCRVLRSL